MKTMSDFKGEAVKFFKALGDPTRYEIICMLLHQKEMSCGECREHFRLSNPAMSHHYRVLENAGLIMSRKRGSHVFYHLNKESLERFVPGFTDVHKECLEEIESN
ncbi:helix-turn-helix transcriptional regulator [Candidatus Acetothermia bacterium]|nr:helix-turn-helix transcriptional regulator [Candidatus Acetothermia bacterium]MBI3643146.1 helix-turn-helix transcriptional regulator [Candidatus Acetothermia bacterium]